MLCCRVILRGAGRAHAQCSVPRSSAGWAIERRWSSESFRHPQQYDMSQRGGAATRIVPCVQQGAVRHASWIVWHILRAPLAPPLLGVRVRISTLAPCPSPPSSGITHVCAESLTVALGYPRPCVAGIRAEQLLNALNRNSTPPSSNSWLSSPLESPPPEPTSELTLRSVGFRHGLQTQGIPFGHSTALRQRQEIIGLQLPALFR